MKNNVPKFLYDLLVKQYEEDLTNKIINGYKNIRKTTLRVNTIKSSIQEIKEILDKNNIEYSTVSWNNEAIVLENINEEEIKKLAIYNDGKIYLQSLSSMLPAIILSPNENEHILDMTAAPGGKTTQMAAMTNNKALIMACEKNKIRCDRLKYNVDKQGCKKVNVLCIDAKNLDPYFSFDKILLDAPCSGSGTIFYSDEKNLKNFNEKLLNDSIKSQSELLDKTISLLKSGQELVYSTCSILDCENELQIKKILDKNLVELIPINKNIFQDIPMLKTSIEGTICILPNDLYEGFFIAKLRKK